MRQVHVITDLQFGSTGKGLFAGWLAKRINPDTVVSAWGPNAGHTFIDKDGCRNVNIMVPNGVIAPSVKRVLIGPGSMIDASRMLDECTQYGLLSGQVDFAIHEHAAVVQDRHRQLESLYGFKIGSTMKGVGEAVIEKIRRYPQVGSDTPIIAGAALRGTPLEPYLVAVEDYNMMLDKAEKVIVEGAQGFSLSINQGFYPYCTSRDCTTAQILSDCGIPVNRRGWGMRVYGVARTYPIRVANRYEECHYCQGQGRGPQRVNGNEVEDDPCGWCDGKGRVQIGTSGPAYWDQMEIGWEAIGVKPELTTVTRLPRRLFTFSGEQVKQAIRMNGVDEVFLNFCNYVKDPLELTGIISKIEAAGAKVAYTGWGEREDQITIINKVEE